MSKSRVFRHPTRCALLDASTVIWSVTCLLTYGLSIHQYPEGYAKQTPGLAVDVKIRKTFEDFSTDPEMVAQLKRLCKTFDDVDFVASVQP